MIGIFGNKVQPKEQPEQPWIAIITPTRGLLFTETAEYIERVRDGYPHIRPFYSHDLPIPECLNNLVREAIQDQKYKYFWFIEEDMVPPDDALQKLLEAIKLGGVAAMDYGFNGGFNTIVRSAKTGRILFTGFGCTLVKREILEKIPDPRFRADKQFSLNQMRWIPAEPHKVYGQHDIWFGKQITDLGENILQVSGESRHLQLIDLGRKEKNDGRHIITEKDKISKHLTLPIERL